MNRSLLRLALMCALVAMPLGADRLPRTVIPDEYKLVITPNLERRDFFAHEVIRVTVLEPVSEITLHAADLDIKKVHVRDEERRQRAEVVADPKSSTITLKLRRNLIPGPAEIRVSYEGPLRDDLKGMYLSNSARDTYIFTQLQPVDARRLFPCFDEPDLKALFDVSVVIDDESIAISNAKVVSTLPGPIRGTRRVRFARTPPMSTYMFALAIGPMDCLRGKHGDIPVRFCAQNGYEWKGRATFEATLDLLEFYEDWFGVPYPFEKLDVVALPDMAAGGMENPGAIFLRQNWALVEKNAPMEARNWSTTLLAHEVSHLWVGDLVTMRWWNDIWLNEGLATYMATKSLAELHPDLPVDVIRTFRLMKAFDEDALGSRGAVASPVESEEKLFEIFGMLSNEKPAAVLSMVEGVTGEEALRRALRDYLITYSWGSADSDDFIGVLGKRVGEDAASVVRDYVTRPGFPVVNVSSSCRDGVRQIDFAEKRAEGADPWSVPVCYRSLPDGPKECFVLKGEAGVTVAGGCDEPLLVNPGVPGYYRVIYARPDLERVIESVSDLSVTERLGLLDNEWWLAMSGHRSVADYLSVLERGFSDERKSAIAALIVGRLGVISREFVRPESRGFFDGWLRSYYGPQLRKVGLEPSPDESESTAHLRGELVWAAGSLARDPEVLSKAQAWVREFLANPAAVDESMADAMINLAAMSGDEALYNVYLSRVRRARDGQEGYRFLMGLTSFTDPALVERTLELTMTDVVRSQDAASIIGRLLYTPETAATAWPFIRERWDDLAKRVPETFTSERIVRAAGSFCTAKQRDEVAAFFGKTRVAPKTLHESLVRIDRCVAARPVQFVAVDEWLSSDDRVATASTLNP